jgi:hypothetical protein
MNFVTKEKRRATIRRLLLSNLLGMFLLLNASMLQAQTPTFQKWNAGVSLGLSPINSYAGYPTIRGNYKNFGVDISPYFFSPGIAFNYHVILQISQKAMFSVDATLYGTRQNGKYDLGFPFNPILHDLNDVGAMAGFSFYFLKRCNLQALVGTGAVYQYGENEFGYSRENSMEFRTKAALTLEVRLFNSFAQ